MKLKKRDPAQAEKEIYKHLNLAWRLAYPHSIEADNPYAQGWKKVMTAIEETRIATDSIFRLEPREIPPFEE